MLIDHPAAPLYREPYSAELDDEAWYGQQAEIIQDMGEFCRIRMSYGYESCIRRRQLADWQYEQSPAAVGLPFGHVHEQADIKARVLLTLPRGALVEQRAEQDGWAEIRLIGGGRGYMRSAALVIRRTPRLMAEALRKNIANTAMEYLGVPYKWGGRTPAGVDCSGLCHCAYLLNGVAIYRNASIQPGYPVHSIPLDCGAEGDLLYFPGHMALYLGEGKYIHASGSSGRVVINSLIKGDTLYREDLAGSLICAGSIF